MSEFVNVERQLFLRGAEKHTLMAAASALRQFFTDVHGACPLIDFISLPPEVKGVARLSFSFSVYGDNYIGRSIVPDTDEWPKKGLVMITKVGLEEAYTYAYFTLFGEPAMPQIRFNQRLESY